VPCLKPAARDWGDRVEPPLSSNRPGAVASGAISENAGCSVLGAGVAIAAVAAVAAVGVAAEPDYH
jgi:hypothetical protein